MKRKRSFTLLEVVVALALLALLGVQLLDAQSRAVRQLRAAEQRKRVALAVDKLLDEWAEAGVKVTLPASGALDEPDLRWVRTARPVRIARGVLPKQVTLTVFDQHDEAVVRVDWWVPDRQDRRSRR